MKTFKFNKGKHRIASLLAMLTLGAMPFTSLAAHGGGGGGGGHAGGGGLHGGGMRGGHPEGGFRGSFHGNEHMNFAHNRGFDRDRGFGRDRRFDRDRDFRFDHNRFGFGFFPGFFVGSLPWDYATVYAGGVPYYYSQGDYYEPDGQGYETVAPPLGAVVAELPSDTVVVTVGDTNYYYARGAYYLPQSNGGYVVVAPPTQASP